MNFTTTRCRTCTSNFRIPEGALIRYCSALCRITSEVPTTGADFKGTGRAHKKRRNHVYRIGDKIDPLAVFIYHNWMCHLCNQKIDPDARLPEDDMAATIDHVIPLSLGGTHTWDNVAPAHAKCNFQKANGHVAA